MTPRLILVAVLVLVLAPQATARAQVEIKIATVAPRGSMWMRVFNKMKARVAKETGGKLRIRYYPGQVQGDERDVVRKMRTGQLHGGSFTPIGLGLINPEVLVLVMPRIFKDSAMLDRVRDKLQRELEQSFEKRGFVLLGWSEVGPIYFFSAEPLRSLGDLRKQKVWAWTDDPVARALLRALKVSPRLLGLPQVLPALNTGMINTVATSPLALLAVQWHSKVRYRLADLFTISVGATVITKKAFDQLSPEHQKTLLKVSRKYHSVALARIRQDNDRAQQALQRDFGIKTHALSAADRQEFERASLAAMRSFVPRYFTQQWLDRVLKLR